MPYPFIRKRIVASVMLATAMIPMLLCEHALARDRTPAVIQVYTVSSIPVQVPPSLRDSTTVIHLDRLGEIESVLAEGLDRIPDGNRETAATSRLSPALQLELKKTWQALSRIRQDRITHLPAIILDDRAVWYGSDLRRAVTRYRNLRNAEGGS